jgi:hypothetical protein
MPTRPGLLLHVAAPDALLMTSERRGPWWSDYSLSLLWLIIFVASFIGSTVTGWLEFVATQHSHGQEPRLFGDDGYSWVLLEQTLQNWQSEFLAVLVLIVLTSILIHRGSALSRDGKDEVEGRARAVERRLDALIAARAGSAKEDA